MDDVPQKKEETSKEYRTWAKPDGSGRSIRTSLLGYGCMRFPTTPDGAIDEERAAALLNTAYRMSHVKQFVDILRTAPKSEIIILIGCFLPTVFIDMVAGVTTGMVLAGLFHARRTMSKTAQEEENINLGTLFSRAASSKAMLATTLFS